VTIPTNINGLRVSAIGVQAFYGTSPTSVTIPASVTSIGTNAFETCASLASVTIGNGVTTIGPDAFYDCTSLTNVTIPGSVTNLGDGAFAGCTSLTSVTIPNSVTSIGVNAFSGCTSLANVTIGNGVTTIGADAFYDCTSLTNVVVGNSVTNIGDYAFFDCFVLRSVFFTGNAPTVGSQVFYYYYNPILKGYLSATIYIQPGTMGWSNPFAGLPVWGPWIITSGPLFGVQNNGFGFVITNTANTYIVVDLCTNLTNPIWSPLLSFDLTNNSVYFSGPLLFDRPGHFFRLNPY
jgi:hypothetical protein